MFNRGAGDDFSLGQENQPGPFLKQTTGLLWKNDATAETQEFWV